MVQRVVVGLLAATIAVAVSGSGVTAGGAPISSDGSPSGGPHGRGGAGVTWEQVAAQLRRSGDTRHGTPPPATAPAPAARLGAAATVGRSVTVTPATGLASGQVVTVDGAGFSGVPEVVVAQCAADATGPDGCDLSTVFFTEVDGTGGFSASLSVHRTVTTASTTVSCVTAPGSCVIIATDPAGPGIDASTPISFDPNAPIPDAKITLAPDANLRAGDVVTVSGTDFVPNQAVVVDQCAVGFPFCGELGGAPVLADGSGSFTATITVTLRVIDAQFEPTSCLVTDCVVFAQSLSNVDYVATAPLALDPNQPPPPAPTLTVTPDTGLRHLQTVQISGTGFDPNASVSISECSADDLGFCDEALADLIAGPDGTFTTSAPVSRLLTTFDVRPGGPSTAIVDCVDGGCHVSAEQFALADPYAPGASAPIEFDASVPPPPLPDITAVPTENLPFRADVTITGTGFAPGEMVQAQFCADSDVFGFCSGGPSGIADGSGAVTFTIRVQRQLSFPGEGSIDCADPTSVCTLQVYGAHGYEQAEFPLSFDPNAEIPPPPTATATPDHDLGYRQVVTLAGSGFAPGDVSVTECADLGTDPLESFTVCGATGTATADAGGNLTGTYRAGRILTDGYDPPVDCSTSFGRCFLVIGSSSYDPFALTAQVPLGFDPGSVAPPPPPVVVDPSTHLHDGQVVDVSGSGFTPNVQIGIAFCTAGTQSLGSCDLSQSTILNADDRGAFATTTAVHATIQTDGGPVDCTAAPGTCVLGVANISDYLEFSLTPLAFETPSRPELEVHSVSVEEGTGGVTAVSVPVDLSGPAPVAITLHWVAEPGTATTADYTATGGSVVIPAGSDHASIPAEVVADGLDEATERFTVRVTDATGAEITDDHATVKIRDDDAEPLLRIGDPRVREDVGGAEAAVLLTAPSGRDITVEFVTHHGSARSGSDYVRVRGSVRIPAGSIVGRFTVPIVDDRVREATESFRIELDDGEHVTIDRGTATATIVDDD
ncbi:MAG: neocarzinostatin apoprotein domain-containing protein [Acidimicrobiia bacterium]